jgi:hypothetical protein
MPLPTSWVDHLFAKLAVRYGAAFLRQWPDAEPALVKADWAEVLDGTSGDALGYALRYLPAAPPNALQFRDICRRAPAPTMEALPAPHEPADPGRVREIVARLHSSDAETAGLPLAERCARTILRIVAERGGRVSNAQAEQLRAMAHMLQPDTLTRARRYVTGMPAGVHSEGAAA